MIIAAMFVLWCLLSVVTAVFLGAFLSRGASAAIAAPVLLECLVCQAVNGKKAINERCVVFGGESPKAPPVNRLYAVGSPCTSTSASSSVRRGSGSFPFQFAHPQKMAVEELSKPEITPMARGL